MKRMTKDMAVDVARRACEAKQLQWQEPIRVQRSSWNRYQVWTAAHRRGGNVIITIDRRTGAVTGLSVTGRKAH